MDYKIKKPMDYKTESTLLQPHCDYFGKLITNPVLQFSTVHLLLFCWYPAAKARTRLLDDTERS